MYYFACARPANMSPHTVARVNTNYERIGAWFRIYNNWALIQYKDDILPV